MSKIRHALGLTKLLNYFEGRIFSAYDVGSWKPDPDLFLHAAQTFGIAPGRCVVIEDSLSGVTAAHAAGMQVIGFSGGDPDVELQLAPVRANLLQQMRDLPKLLKMGGR